MINRLLKNLFPLLLVSIYLNSTAQKNTADSIALVACIDSINAHISKDATCSYCNSILDKCSTPDAVKNYPELVSSAFRRVEDCYHNKYDLAHTVPVIERLGKLARDNNSDDLQAWYLNMTGQMMFNANQSDSVLPVLLHSLKLFEKIKTSRDGLSLTCEFLGGVYWKINDTTKCIYYHKKSLEYAEGSKWLKHIMLTNISVYYTRVKQYDSARTYTLRAIEEEDKYKRGHGVSYITLLRIDYNSGADEKTLESDFQNGMPQSQNIKDRIATLTALIQRLIRTTSSFSNGRD